MVDEPATYNESINSTKSNMWLKAMKSKMEAKYTNNVLTWVKSPPPPQIDKIDTVQGDLQEED